MAKRTARKSTTSAQRNLSTSHSILPFLVNQRKCFQTKHNRLGPTSSLRLSSTPSTDTNENIPPPPGGLVSGTEMVDSHTNCESIAPTSEQNSVNTTKSPILKQQRLKRAIDARRRSQFRQNLKDLKRYDKAAYNGAFPDNFLKRYVERQLRNYLSSDPSRPKRIRCAAIELLRVATIEFAVSMFQQLNLITLHAKRVTLMPPDMVIWRRICQKIHILF